MKTASDKYDVLVIGGGHAGCEAALAAARMGAETLLITLARDTIAQMSCNPAIGGIGKGHLVKEIDALGGEMGKVADATGIQFRVLNASRGAATRGSRCQSDFLAYKTVMRQILEKQSGLKIVEGHAEKLLFEGNQVVGLRTENEEHFAETVIITTGTFLNGLIHRGKERVDAGRVAEPSAKKLSLSLANQSLKLGRMKTGTPARLDKRSIDWKQLGIQLGDDEPKKFSFWDSEILLPQVPCHIAYTNERTHRIIKKNLSKSALYGGEITGIGPRYCPSIEDKVVRFADRISHQIFLEPEGLNCNEVYPNGISTSLPFDVQQQLVRSIKGFENAHITRPGYAIEYDYFDPRDLKQSLETKVINGLFFAGQINGTTGYEEAGAQGLIAGLNAALQAQGKESWSPRRDQAYMGVLIDDLSTLGTQEPYRMFTSRAEYRLLLREDNADIRLTEIGRNLGLVDDERWAAFNEKMEAVEQEKQRLKATWVHKDHPAVEQINALVKSPVTKEVNGEELLRRPEIHYKDLAKTEFFAPGVTDPAAAEQVEIQIKYAGYISRQQDEIAKQQRHENTLLPSPFDYAKIKGLSNEVIAKLNDHQPETVGKAARISGITPAAISMLLVHLKKQGLLRKSA